MNSCRLCGQDVREFGEATLLHRYLVTYYRCETCGYVSTEEPYWLSEAYANALVAIDTGAVGRNLKFAAATQAIIQQWFQPDARFLDYGAGYGLFVRLMRDRGFDFRWSDKYAENLLSMGFEAESEDRGFEIVTAFEVFEHLPDPVDEVAKMLERGSTLLFSTELLPKPVPRPGEWWYYTLSSGQHVSLYTLESLQVMARRFDRHLVTDGARLHMFSARPISSRMFCLMTRRFVPRLVNRLRRRRSLTGADYESLSGGNLHT
jgi:hypothetical protein